MPLLYCQAVKAGLNIMRNKSLDAGKAMAAFGVVFIHVSFPGTDRADHKGTCQISSSVFLHGVRIFLLLIIEETPTEENGSQIKYRQKVQHILTLLAFALLFYFLWESAMHLVEKEAIGPWLQEMVKKEHLKELFRYNSTSQLKPHLWFLPALIYCYILVISSRNYHLGKLAYLSVLCFWDAFYGLGVLWQVPGCFLSYYGIQELFLYGNALFPDRTDDP